ncbi:MAG: hypothetical protein ACQEQG_03990 [Bacillota bacterium]
MTDIIKPGRLVISLAGRDKGKLYIVIAHNEKDNFLRLSDGKKHPIDDPKKKNFKHVKQLEIPNNDLITRFSNNERVRNSDLRAFLKYIANQEEVSN